MQTDKPKRKRAPTDPTKKAVILQNVDRDLFDRALVKCQATRVNGRPLALTRVIEALVRDWVVGASRVDRLATILPAHPPPEIAELFDRIAEHSARLLESAARSLDWPSAIPRSADPPPETAPKSPEPAPTLPPDTPQSFSDCPALPLKSQSTTDTPSVQTSIASRSEKGTKE